MSLSIILLVLLVLAVAFPLSYGRSYGPYGWSPLGLVLLVIILLFFLGHLHVGRW